MLIKIGYYIAQIVRKLPSLVISEIVDIYRTKVEGDYIVLILFGMPIVMYLGIFQNYSFSSLCFIFLGVYVLMILINRLFWYLSKYGYTNYWLDKWNTRIYLFYSLEFNKLIVFPLCFIWVLFLYVFFVSLKQPPTTYTEQAHITQPYTKN